MTHEKIERLIAIMSSNKIKYNKQFRSILEHGFSDEARETFFEEVVAELETLLGKGVNGSFTKSMKETARDLTDLAVRSGEEGRRAAALEKLRQEKRNMMATSKSSKEVHMEFDLRYNVKQYIESTVTGMKVLEEPGLTRTASEESNMKSCSTLLREIGEAVDRTLDVSSIEAGNRYNEVIEKLRSYRIRLARSGGLYDAGLVGTLREALNAAKDWEKLCTFNAKRAKTKDVYTEIPADDLTRTVESEVIKESVGMFLARCEAYAKETATMGKNGVMERIMELRAQLREIGAKEQNVVAQFRNGELTRDDAEFELQRYKDEKDYINYEIERVKIDKISPEEIAIRRAMISKIERPIRQIYNHVKSNRLHIHTVFNGIDFPRLVGMINNSVSQGEFESGIAELQQVLVTRGLLDNQGQVLRDNLMDALNMVDRLEAEENGVKETTEEVSLLDQMLGADQKQGTGSLLDQHLGNENIQRTRSDKRLDDIL